MLRVDLHTHTLCSADALTKLEADVRRCVERGIAVAAVTDHHSIAGARAVAAIAPFEVIVGEEIKAKEGELIGLFLREAVPAGLSAKATSDRAHDQGGLILAPHLSGHKIPSHRAAARLER